MNLTLSSLLQSCLATLAYFVLLLPSGYGVGRLFDLAGFRVQSRTQKVLWSVVLSFPVGLFTANLVGRLVPPRGALLVLVLWDLVCLVWIAVDQRGQTWSPLKLDRYSRIVLFALAAEVLYIWCAGAPLQFRHRLYEPVFSGDWEIRFPLVQAALRDGVPPRNPFFTVGGQSPPMRYYYYWYSLCGLIARCVHTDPRATLLGSSAYAAIGITATLFLFQRYAIPSSVPLRRRCAVLLGVCCILGLDVLPSTLRLLFWRVRLLPEIEWWSQDRTPGLASTIIYAPHHIAGTVCGLLAFLLLLLLLQSPGPSWRTVAGHGCLIALTFAALVGTSTFVCLFFGVACAVLCLDQLRQRNVQPAVALALGAVLSVAVSVPYLHELLAKTVTGAAQAQHRKFLIPELRDNNFAHSLIAKLSLIRHKPQPGGVRRLLYRLPILPLLYLCETGFFAIAAWLQFQRDFRSAHPATPRAKGLWLLAASVSFFFFFVSSEAIQNVNDLGLQAGLVLRIVLILWGTRVIAEYLEQRRARAFTRRQTWLIRVATIFVALGVTMSLWQALVERTYAILADRRILPAISPYPYAYRIGAVYFDIHQAQAAVAHLFPKDAVVQSDPTGRYQTIFRLYQTRRQAAGDETCEGAFGGDPAVCQSFAPALLHLFGSHPPLPDKRLRGPKPNPADMTPEALAFVCHQDGLAAVAASRADPVWYDPQSWVWHGHLLYANTTVRVVQCPSTLPSAQ